MEEIVGSEAMFNFVKNNIIYLVMWLIFVLFGIVLFVLEKKIFYLFNFTYIGTCVTWGVYLVAKKKNYARNVVQFSIGCYMLIYLGIICRENMQLEGFWYYLFLGVFEAATIHYFLAKIVGPLFFGRGFCGYACWTGMVLDILPYKKSSKRVRMLGCIKYLLFVFSFLVVLFLFVFVDQGREEVMFWLFIIGNICYYVVGILLAFLLRDNRAFCKYICPVAVFLKPASYFSYLRVKCDRDKCRCCGKCVRNCPMNVDVLDNSRRRKNGTDCILCLECVNECPVKALKL